MSEVFSLEVLVQWSGEVEIARHEVQVVYFGMHIRHKVNIINKPVT
jgi:hypothetical protein